MKISDLVRNAARHPGLRARLVRDIELDTGVVLREGTVSTLLVPRGDGTYHFEACDTACAVTRGEIAFLKIEC
jgi:hypothetical protein